jgi:acetyl esterase/lipase
VTNENSDGAYEAPALLITIPAHLSAEAQAVLKAPLQPATPYPALDDAAGWRQMIQFADAYILNMVSPLAAKADVSISEMRAGEALAYDIKPRANAAGDRRVYLDIHGGALIMGAGETCKAMATAFAGRLGARVVAVDYRMPPDYPFPAGLDDCLAIYRALLKDHKPAEIVIGGGSAGGNVATALILKARDEGLPLPAGAVLMTPELDLTESGDSFQTNLGVDRVLRSRLMPANLLYAQGAKLTDPYVSPLFGDFTKGFPPTMLTAGTRDLFLSNAVRVHRALRQANVKAELHVFEAMSHGGFGATPEDAELDREVRAFCEACWDAA